MTDTSSVKILIGTPAYRGLVHTSYVHSLLDFQHDGISFKVQTINNESLITRARNTIIASFWSSPEYTHLLFLDGDVRMNGESLKQLIAHHKDVIGAPVPLKGKDKDGNQPYNTNADMNAEPGLQVVHRVGTAVFMLSCHAVAMLVTDAMKDKRSYRVHELLLGPDIPELQYDIFGVGVKREEYLSEDFWVCESLKQLGFQIHVDTSIEVKHTGMKTF